MLASDRRPSRFRRQPAAQTVDGLAYVVGIGGNVAVIPQIIQTWSSPAPGLAILSWLMFMGIGTLWLVYAIMHQQRPLIAAQIAGLACNGAVVLGWAWHHWPA